MSRGIKNNNPGNIRLSGAHWLGKIDPSKDADFEQFDTPELGIRALAKTLLAYYQNHGLDTIEGIISRWAPSNENDTKAYIEQICGQCGFSADEALEIDNADVLAGLCEAIIYHENGSCPYTPEQVDKGVEMALT